MTQAFNIADRLHESANRWPQQIAVVQPIRRDAAGKYQYRTWTFAELNREADGIAQGLADWEVSSGDRLVLMVRPSLEFIALTFGLMRAGAVVVLIDPGMGRANIVRCLADIDPSGFVAIPLVQLLRVLNRRRFPHARCNVTVGGRKWFWRGKSYGQLIAPSPLASRPLPLTTRHSPAAILFTSGSTGPPKGVVYEHGMFDAQVELIRDFYGIQPGEVDLPGFPLFGLFNAAMGVTTVIPDMDPASPARVDPARILAHLRDWNVTQAFGSPAIWNRVGRYCADTGTELPATLRRVLSAGAPVSLRIIEQMRQAFSHPDADIHTPYGATESLPVASISGREVLEQTASLSRQGKGTCVGRPFLDIDVRIIEITDGPIRSLKDVRELPRGEIGEILVRSPSTTREYFCQVDATDAAKVFAGEVERWGDGEDETHSPHHPIAPPPHRAFFHRMGDVGYLDEQGRLWFCGRKAHVVETWDGRMFTIPCEAIFNNDPRVFRSALVGVGSKPHQRPVMIVEPENPRSWNDAADRDRLCGELLQLAKSNPLTAGIDCVLMHPSMPVDIRHNVKIFREKLANWAEYELAR